MISLHVFEALLSPPARYPDIFPVLNVLLSSGVFTLCWLWTHVRLWEECAAMSGGLKVGKKL